MQLTDVFRRSLLNWEQTAYKHDSIGIHALAYNDLVAECVFRIPLEEWPIEFSRYIEAAAAYEIAPRANPEVVFAMKAERAPSVLASQRGQITPTRGVTDELSTQVVG